MDANTIISIVSGLGFPIVACFGCAWYINKQSDSHKQEIDKITEALNNNTLALTRLIDKLGGEPNESGNIK